MDETAFHQLFRTHYVDLVRLAQRYLYDRGEAEDVVQEVFIRLWEKKAVMQIQASPKGYLYSMVKNRCLDYLRSIKITDNQRAIEDFLVSDGIQDQESISFRQQEVKKVLVLMPEGMRTICELKYLFGYTYEEISEELDISRNTVKTQLRRARTRFLEGVTILIFFGWYFF